MNTFLLGKWIAAIALPPTGPIVVALLSVLLRAKLRHPAWKRLAGVVTVACLATVVLLSLPIVGNALLASLDRYPPISDQELQSAQAIVILGGGMHRGAPEYGGDTVARSTLQRLRYGARLQRKSRLPILVTGGAPFGGTPEGDLMRDTLENDFAVPVRWVESASRNTRENASASAIILRRAGISRIALVSHSWHLPRAVSLFERAGFTVIPAPTAFAEVTTAEEAFLPDEGAKSRVAVQEYVGLVVNCIFNAGRRAN